MASRELFVFQVQLDDVAPAVWRRLHDPELTHALKEVDGVALAVAERPEQVVEILRYVITGELGCELG